jgi:hypothetical protein
MKPKSLVRLQIHQDLSHSLSVRPFAELSDRVRSDDRGGGQVPKEIPSLADAHAGDVAYRTPTQVAHTRQYAPPHAGGKSCLLSTFPGFIPYLERHRDTTKRRIAGAARRSVRSGRSLLVGVRCRCAMPQEVTSTTAEQGCSPSRGCISSFGNEDRSPIVCSRSSSSIAVRRRSRSRSADERGVGPFVERRRWLRRRETRGAL